MPILKYPVAGLGVTFAEVPDRTSVFIELGNCKQHCKGCHSPELQQTKEATLSLDDILLYVNNQIDAGANAIVILGGTNNDMPIMSLKILISALSEIAPTCLYSGCDDADLHKELFYESDLTWLKTGSYKESLGGLQKKTTNQRFLKKSVRTYEDSKGNVGVEVYPEDLTFLFQEI